MRQSRPLPPEQSILAQMKTRTVSRKCRADGLPLSTRSDWSRPFRSRSRANHRAVLLAPNPEGFTNLIRLATAAHVTGFHYQARIDKQMLVDRCAARPAAYRQSFLPLVRRGRQCKPCSRTASVSALPSSLRRDAISPMCRRPRSEFLDRPPGDGGDSQERNPARNQLNQDRDEKQPTSSPPLRVLVAEDNEFNSQLFETSPGCAIN